ncbi:MULTISPECIES: MetS family NSS transporter small subunit [unclassified Clostridium]|nr:MULTISPECIES: MetS family NSS transporter small subunit [unclassified Clostridium]NFG61103.1 MetS family NSS transporter small subunit [Clostridium botulinum]NFQ08849.1 MetS family NSS transporter small subunit [Clostridium botulinum]
MTSQAILFLILGATILWGGLIITLLITRKKESTTY